MANWHSFYKRPLSERLTILTNNQNLTTAEQQLMQNSLPLSLALLTGKTDLLMVP